MQAFWFGVIAVLWAGFFVLEGFDFGVGVLLPAVARNDQERKVALRSIGPVWDGNEVWLLTAGGATFAAFPLWYASMFSGFYLAFALLLVGLILRGIGIEYRGKAHTESGRRWCDLGVVVGSFLPALLLGVAFANLIRGVRMNANHDMTSSFFSLLSPYALLGGVVTLTVFAFHGAVYLALRTTGEVHDVARSLIPVLAPVTAVAAVAFLAWSSQVRGGAVSFGLAVVIAVTFVAAAVLALKDREGLAFAASAVVTLLVPVWVFACLWPNVLPARNHAAWSLTVHNASSSPYTLKVMTVVALVMTPIVLVYQAWTYWIFRARVTGADVAGDGYGGAVATTIARARQSAAEMLGHAADQGKPAAAGGGVATAERVDIETTETVEPTTP
jgi:cytochrome d ubiquinol oxidase subunit II